MQIVPPFGYKEVVPFQKGQKVRLPEADEIPLFAQKSNALPISHAEFQPIAREYPIVFTAGGDGKIFAPVAVLGFAAEENLFVAGGAWARGAYIPAYARRYPFCMVRLTIGEVEQQKRLICVEKQFLDEQRGEAMFDGERPSARWGDIGRLVTEYEADLERSREMCAILADYGLLEPFAMQATLPQDRGGGALHITGMHRVSEKNLENLNAGQLKNLLHKGLMARIYLHLVSLDNFSRLLERKAARPSAGDGA